MLAEGTESKVTKIIYIQERQYYNQKKKKNGGGYTEIRRLTCSNPCRQPPTVSLTSVNDKIPFFGIICQSSFRSQFLGFILLLSVSFLCRINLDNRVLLVSCVDLLKTKFTISLSELRVDHRFLLRDEYPSVSTLIFFCWAYVDFYHIFWSKLTVSFVGKKSNNTASRL